jgi:hypothetical protein
MPIGQGSMMLMVAKDTGNGRLCTKYYSDGRRGLFNGFTKMGGVFI